MLENINQIIKKKSFPPILLMFGEEEFLLESAYDKLIHTMFPDRSNEFDFEVLDGEESDLERVVDSCISFPFMSDKRVVIVKNFEKMAPGRVLKKSEKNNSFLKYIKSPQPTTVLILKTNLNKLNGYSAAIKGNKTKKKNSILKSAKFPYDTLLEQHEWIEYPKMYDSGFTRWIKHRAKEFGKTITNEAAEFLIAKTEQNLRELNNELEKTVIYIYDRKRIELEDVTFVVGASRKFNVFELQKSVGKKDVPNSLKIIEKMLSNESQEMLILTILSRYFISLWKLMELAGRNMNNYELAGQIGVSPFFVNEYLEALGRYRPAEIEKALMVITQTDEMLKSTSLDSMYAIQKMVIQIINK